MFYIIMIDEIIQYILEYFIVSCKVKILMFLISEHKIEY